MYNLWWVVIGFGIATIIFSTLCYILERRRPGFCMDWWGSSATCLFAVVTGAVCFILVCIAISNPITAKKEYNEFLQTKVLVEQVYQGDFTQYENLGLNSKIIELNQWLVKAKADKKQWGNWSMYYALDVENLDYIVLKQ